MKKYETLFLTTIFPASEMYLDDFFKSLENQTITNFDVLIINDGIKDFENYRLKYSSLNLIEIKSNGSPAKNRQVGINKALDLNYKYLIFGDSDDYFSENRIEKSLKALRNNDIVINELTLFNQDFSNKNFFKNNLENDFLPFKDIFKSNIFGFSNIALRAELLSQPIKFDDKLIAVDWYFITTLLLTGKPKVKFLENVQTFYRQHAENTIGMSTLVTKEKLSLGLKVKEIHYASVINYCNSCNLKEYYTIFESKYKEIKNLQIALVDSEFFKKYIDIVNKNQKNIFTGWWSEIISIEEYNKYEKSTNK